VVRLVVTGGSLTRKPKRSLRCLLVEISWQINASTYLPTNLFLEKKAAPFPYLLITSQSLYK